MTPPSATTPDLTFITLDPHDETGRNGELLEGWGQAIPRGFHGPRMSATMRRTWLEHCRADGVTIRGAWQPDAALGAGTIPVATYSSFDKSINSGLEQLPLRMITDVTVSPTHRRRGLLRRMITEDLADAAERGLPLAALTATEGTIYGRFGFGIASRLAHVEVDTTARFALRADAGDGVIELVEPEEAWPAVQAVFARFHQQTRGSVERPQFYEATLTGRFHPETHESDPSLRAAVHLGADGEPDGYVHYRISSVDGRRCADVADLVAVHPTTYLRLWRLLADLDLVERVRWRRAPLVDPLPWSLVDPYVARVTKVEDLLWLRVLDVVRALEARPWGADGETVLEVDDPLGYAAGRWRVSTVSGRAAVAATTDPPDLRLTADTLASLHLGGTTAANLAAAGRLDGEATAVTRFAAMADAGPTPYCITGF
ncbi:MAG: GNAT family N-acetyltransferase [Nocardioides sp.]